MIVAQLPARDGGAERDHFAGHAPGAGRACDNCGIRRYFAHLERRRAMPAIDEDDRPKKKITHEIGQDLTLLSVKELQERIALMKEEIARLDADIARKEASRNVADRFFKK
jgi:uncharacterized small protein (DUF1192 family)